MNTANKVIIAVSGILAVSAIAAAAFRLGHRVAINCNLTPEEYDRICDEFHLNPSSAMMEYIYRRGGERFGVRLAPGKLCADDLMSIFTIPIIKEKIPQALSRKSSYPTSDSTVVRASSFTPSAKRGYDYKVHIFKVNGCEYMEIEKPKTDNIGIFLHS